MTLPIVPALLLAVCLLLLVLYLQFRWRYRHLLAVASKLPCPPALPILGNALLFFGDLTDVTNNLLRLAKEYKGIFCVWMGPIPIFVVVDPSNIQAVLNSSSMLTRDDVYSLFKVFLGNGILTAPPCTWKKYRKLINPVLHPSNVEHFLPVFNDVGRNLVKQLTDSTPSLDPTNAIFDMAMDAIMRTVISRTEISADIKKEVKNVYHIVGEVFILRVFKVWLHVDWIFRFVYWREMKQTLRVLAKAMDAINQGWKEEYELRNEQNNKYNERLSGLNLVDVVFDNQPLVTQDHDWRDEVTTMIAAATDTIVGTLSFLFVTLGNHPDVQEKIFAELLEVMGDLDREVTAADVNAMTYLGQVILESIRLHGSIVAIMRKATKDTKLPDCTLPAGSRVLVMLYSLGWNKEQFPDPEQFLPERFAPEKQKERQNNSFLPFSAGPRNCIGKTYAMTVMKTVLVHVLRRLRVTSHTKLSDIEYELKVVMYSKTPLMVSFHPR